MDIAALIIWATQHDAASQSRTSFQWVVLVSIISGVLGVLVLALGAAEVTPPKNQTATQPLRLRWRGLDVRFRALVGVMVL